MNSAEIELNRTLCHCIDQILNSVPPGKTYSVKDPDIRIKWLDRGTQKAIKIYVGRNKMLTLEEVAQREGGPVASEEISEEDEE